MCKVSYVTGVSMYGLLRSASLTGQASLRAQGSHSPTGPGVVQRGLVSVHVCHSQKANSLGEHRLQQLAFHAAAVVCQTQARAWEWLLGAVSG